MHRGQGKLRGGGRGGRAASVGRDVLLGPTTPWWPCPKCGRTNNFASRVVCTCGKPAPPEVRAAAYAADAVARTQGAIDPIPNRGKGGAGASYRDVAAKQPSAAQQQQAANTKALEERLKKMEKALAEQAKGQAPAAPKEKDASVAGAAAADEEKPIDLTKLHAAVTTMEEAFGKESPAYKLALQEWDEARKQKLESKPLGLQVRTLEDRARKKAAALEHAAEASKKAKAACMEALRAAKECATKEAECRTEKEALDKEVEEMRRKQLGVPATTPTAAMSELDQVQALFSQLGTIMGSNAGMADWLRDGVSKVNEVVAGKQKAAADAAAAAAQQAAAAAHAPQQAGNTAATVVAQPAPTPTGQQQGQTAANGAAEGAGGAAGKPAKGAALDPQSPDKAAGKPPAATEDPDGDEAMAEAKELDALMAACNDAGAGSDTAADASIKRARLEQALEGILEARAAKRQAKTPSS